MELKGKEKILAEEIGELKELVRLYGVPMLWGATEYVEERNRMRYLLKLVLPDFLGMREPIELIQDGHGLIINLRIGLGVYEDGVYKELERVKFKKVVNGLPYLFPGLVYDDLILDTITCDSEGSYHSSVTQKLIIKRENLEKERVTLIAALLGRGYERADIE